MIPACRARSTARLEGADTATTMGMAAIAAFWTISKLDLPLTHIRTIKFNGDQETVSVAMTTGDRFFGVLNLEAFEVTAVFGNISVGLTHIARIEVRSASPPQFPRRGFIPLLFQDDFNDNDIGDWKNRPIVKDIVGDERKSRHPMSKVADGKVRGAGGGYNYSCPWMIKACKLDGAGEMSVFFRGKSGPALMNQAAVWLLADSWQGNMKPAAGYQLLLYGEGAKRLSVYRYDETGSREIARFTIGTAIHSQHTYLVRRDARGNWSASMDGKRLPRGAKDAGTPDLTFRDMTYKDFSFLGIHFNSAQSEFDFVGIGRRLPAEATCRQKLSGRR